MSEFEVSKLVTDYNDMGMGKLAEKYNLSKGAVRKHLVEAGVSIRGKGRPKGFLSVPKTTTSTTEPTTEVDPFDTSSTPPNEYRGPNDFRGLID